MWTHCTAFLHTFSNNDNCFTFTEKPFFILYFRELAAKLKYHSIATMKIAQIIQHSRLSMRRLNFMVLPELTMIRSTFQFISAFELFIFVLWKNKNPFYIACDKLVRIFSSIDACLTIWSNEPHAYKQIAIWMSKYRKFVK